jgi:hypothetical protein
MKTFGSGGTAPSFLTLALDGGEWLPSRTGRFTPEERALGTHWIRGWSGRCGEEKNLPLPAIEPRLSSPKPRLSPRKVSLFLSVRKIDGESGTCVAAANYQARTTVPEERENAGLCWSVERESAGGVRRPAKPVY